MKTLADKEIFPQRHGKGTTRADIGGDAEQTVEAAIERLRKRARSEASGNNFAMQTTFYVPETLQAWKDAEILERELRKRKPYRDRLPITLTVVAMLGVLAAVWWTSPALPQTALHEPMLGHCYPYRVVVTTLFTKFKEVSTGRTLVEQTGSAVEVFISPKGTISVVEVRPDYLTCYRAFSSPNEFWGAPPANMVPT